MAIKMVVTNTESYIQNNLNLQLKTLSKEGGSLKPSILINQKGFL